MEVPVKVGEEYEVEIQSVGAKGDGIARIKGFVLFVPKVKQGDSVKIRVTKVLEKVGFAEVVKGLGTSPREKKFATITKEELEEEESEPEGDYEDTEDFGEDEE